MDADNKIPTRPEILGSPRTVAHHPVAPPSQPGRYVPKMFHARGGMGEVWLAEDTEIGREVALKRIRRDRPEQVERFLIEAQITGQLEHPGIVPVHDLGSDPDGKPFYIMKRLHGGTLKQAIADHHRPDQAGNEPTELRRLRLLGVFINLCQTMAYAHSRGVIHRDLKPDNVMLGPFGETVVLDWGLAKVRGRTETTADNQPVRLTSSGGGSDTGCVAVLGTPSYMPPELAEGKAAEADERTDVYLLGATLYQILTNHAPHQGSSHEAIIEHARTIAPVAPRQLTPDVPRPLEAICLKAMADRKEDRYATATELAQEVQRFLAGEPVLACPEAFPARLGRWCRRHRQALGRSAVAALLLGLIVAGVMGVQRVEQSRKAAQREADRLLEQEEARRQLLEFRRLADEAHFYAASTDPIAEHAPYYDPQRGERSSQAALELARQWGAALEQFPLEEERTRLRQELHALLLLTAQVKSQRSGERKTVDEVLPLLDQALALGGRSQGHDQLRAWCHKLFPERATALTDRQNPLPASALDHFLAGEQLRQKVAGSTRANPEQVRWQPAPELLEPAIARYRAALAVDPGHYWSLFQLGRCYLNLGRAAEAVEALGACVVLRPNVPWGYSTRGLALGLVRRFEDARRDFDAALKLDPECQPARLNRGVVAWLRRDGDRGLADFDALLPAAEAGKRLIEAAYYRGVIRLEQGKYREARSDFDQVVKEKPSFRPAHLLRARTWLLEGQDQDGLAALDSFLIQARPVDVSSAEAHELRGRLLWRMIARGELPPKKTELALGQLRKAVELGGQSAALFGELGTLLEKQGQLVQALDHYSRALARDPTNARLLNQRGWAYTGVPKYEQAEKDFAQAVRVAASDARGRELRAEAYAGLGYLHARRKAVGAARDEAARSLLDGAGDYLNLHNVACIYAELALVEPQRQKEYENLSLDLLRRGKELWRRGGKGPSAIQQMKEEEKMSFRSLRFRPEFQALLKAATQDSE